MRRPAGMTSRPMPSPGMRPARWAIRKLDRLEVRRRERLLTYSDGAGGHCGGEQWYGELGFVMGWKFWCFDAIGSERLADFRRGVR